MEKKTLYLECSSGISGDMTVAALLDLGADEKVLRETLESLSLSGYHIEIGRVKKSGLDVCDFRVILNADHENHDHDMKYLHHEEPVPAHLHAHTHRGMPEILEIIQKSKMTERAKETAKHVFTVLAQAEAKAHGIPINKVHFHEVGAVDSIVDIVAAAVCFDNLQITDCIIPVLYEGCGTVRCQHGILPIPVPAVVNIVQNHGLELSITGIKGEFVTPTGAAIAAVIKTSSVLPESFTIQAVGMGAGKREYERPSILRAMLLSETECNRPLAPREDIIWKLESNIDDSTGEELGFCMEELLKAGARDVHYFPVFMKKNRPAYQLNAICMEEDIERLEQIIFKQTATLGIRKQKMERQILERKVVKIQTSLGEAMVKFCELGGKIRCYPEYESVRSLCSATGLSYREVYEQITIESEGHER